MQYFTNEAAALAYIQAEFMATLEDDLGNMEHSEREHYTDEDRDQMRARIADLQAIMPRLHIAPA